MKKLMFVLFLLFVYFNIFAQERLLFTLNHNNPVLSVDYSPISNVIITAAKSSCRYGIEVPCCHGRIYIWDAMTGRLIRDFAAHSDSIYLSYSPDGRYFVSGARSSREDIKFWDSDTYQLVHTITEEGRVEALAYSNDGRYIAIGSSLKNIQIWDIETRTLLTTIPESGLWMQSEISFSRDGRAVFSTSGRVINIWNVETGRLLRRLTGHSRDIWRVTTNPNGLHIASGSQDGTIKIWDIDTGNNLQTINLSGTVTAITYRYDGKIIAAAVQDGYAGIGQVCIIDTDTGRILRRFNAHEYQILTIKFSPDGTRVITGSNDRTLKVWDVSNIN